MADTIDIPESRAARWILCACAFAFVIAGIFIFALGPTDRTVTAVATIVFALLAMKLFDWAMSPGARVTISDIGIEDRNNGIGLIEWRDITAVRSARIDDTEFISISLRNEADYLARLTPFKRRASQLGVRMGYSPINIAMFNLKISSAELEGMIRERMSRNGTLAVP